MDGETTKRAASSSAGVKLPKKRKKGLIIGLLGSLTVLAIIAGVLFYFLWWQKPEHIVARAIAGFATAEKSTSTAKVEVNNDQVSLELTAKIVNQSPRQKADANLKVTSKHPQMDYSVDVSLATVYGEDGVFYFKTDGLSEAVDTVLDKYIQVYTERLGDSNAQQQQTEALKQEFRNRMMGPSVATAKMIDGQWVKIAADDLQGERYKSMRCVLQTLKQFNADGKARRELADIYDRHPFLVVKNSKQQEGLIGYEIDLNSDQSIQERQAFVDEFSSAESTKELSDCLQLNKSGSNNNTTATKATASNFVIWLNSGQLKKVELSDDKGTKVTMEFDTGTSEQIDIPTNTKSAKEVADYLFSAPRPTLMTPPLAR